MHDKDEKQKASFISELGIRYAINDSVCGEYLIYDNVRLKTGFSDFLPSFQPLK